MTFEEVLERLRKAEEKARQRAMQEHERDDTIS